MFYPIKKIYNRLRIFRKLWNSYEAPWDIIDSILEFNMELFCEFYERGKLDLVGWDYDEYHQQAKQKMDEIYNWWKIERQNTIEQIDEVLSLWSEHHKSWWEDNGEIFEGEEVVSFKSIDTKYSDYLFDLHRNLERILEAEDEKYLMMLIEIRNFLWT